MHAANTVCASVYLLLPAKPNVHGSASIVAVATVCLLDVMTTECAYKSHAPGALLKCDPLLKCDQA